ncbi:hypothetical protein H0H92_009258 [Tricholoma furcatifolium]|nr:hypothetical protein H0H92_009258 [Tricholoma furcatifolium]
MTLKENLTAIEVTSKEDHVPALNEVHVPQPATVQRVQKDRTKRRRTHKATDVSQFLDLEAEVSSIEDDEEDDASDIGNFINDNDSSESEASDVDPSTLSHRALAHMMSMEESNVAWKLRDAGKPRRTGKRPESPSDNTVEPSSEDDSIDKDIDRAYFVHDYPDSIKDVAPAELVPASLLPFLPQPEFNNNLWRVSVKRGQEEALAFTLYRKAIEGSLKVLSVVARVSCPGWIYVEAKDFADVQKLIDGVTNIYQNNIIVVPPEQQASVLREPPFTYPAPGSWVRVQERGLYRSDLAWVANRVRGMQCDLFVVPRVDLYPQKRKRQGKGRGRAKQKGVKAPRIPQQLLDPKNLEDLGFEITKVHTHDNLPLPQEFLFRGHRYSDGYAIISTTLHKPAIPTRAELNMFKDCSLIPSGEIVALEERLDALRLSVGDPVKVTGGEVSGALGHIVDLSLDSSESQHLTSTATVETSDGVRIEVSFHHLRKILAVGDSVLIVDGVHQGFTGWIVCIEGGIVHLFDDASGKGVRALLVLRIMCLND